MDRYEDDDEISFLAKSFLKHSQIYGLIVYIFEHFFFFEKEKRIVLQKKIYLTFYEYGCTDIRFHDRVFREM